MQRSPLHTARESDGRGGREITGKHPGRPPRDDRRGQRGEQRAAGVQTPTCDAVCRGESAPGASARGAQCPRPHEPLPFRPTLQAKRRRAPASVPGPSPDRRGASVTGGSNGADRRDLAVGRISDAESLHDDVSADHRNDTERVPQQRGRRRRAVIEVKVPRSPQGIPPLTRCRLPGLLCPVTSHLLELNMLGEYQPLAHRASWRGDRDSTLYCPGERPVWSRKTRERWEPSTKPASSATRSSL